MVKQKDECFLLQNQDKKLNLSPMKIESIIISNKAMISTQAISLALENNVDLIFLDKYGFPIGRVWFSKMGSTALIRRKQLDAAKNELGMRLVIELVRQKLKNQIEFLKKLKYARPGKKELFQAPLHTISSSLEACNQNFESLEESRSQIMGIEGAAGRAYFSCISKVMPEKYRFDGRSRRPAEDPFNAVLNYCYGVLYSKVEKACILAGLDPFVGFMHTDNYNKKSLVFDLIEPFRIFAEQVSVYLFTGKKARDNFFDIHTTSTSLNEKGKPFVIDQLYKHLEESVRYRNRNVKRKHIINHEAHRMANILLEDGDGSDKWLQIKEF